MRGFRASGFEVLGFRVVAKLIKKGCFHYAQNDYDKGTQTRNPVFPSGII